MSDPGKAVFLSYASQDAEAAKRICDALRAAGVEVWFDQNELVGGDAWDQKIRRQIKECALFVPLISANTQARVEGYFRLEWKLAVDRSHLMADDQPFLFPIVVGDVSDATARVPDKFREVQWTRLRLDETPAELASRIDRLLCRDVSGSSVRPQRAPVSAGRPQRRPAWLRHGWTAFGLIIALAFWLRPFWSGQRKEPARSATSSAPAAPSPPASTGEAEALTGKAYAITQRLGFTREDLALAETYSQRAVELAPDSARARSVHAWVRACYLNRNWDLSDDRRQEVQTDANRALGLDPNDPDALNALAQVFEKQRLPAEVEKVARRAVAASADNYRGWLLLGRSLLSQDRRDEAQRVLSEAAERFPRNPLCRYELASSYASLGFNFAPITPEGVSAAIEQLDAAIALQPFASAILVKIDWEAAGRGNLTAMRTELDRLETMPMADRTEDRAVFMAMWGGLLERNPERVLTAAKLTARPYFEDSIVAGPKAWGVALAYRIAGKDALAQQQWLAAEAVLRERLREHPNERDNVFLATTLAWQGDNEGAARIMRPIETAWREDLDRARTRDLARYYAARGEAEQAVPLLRDVVNRHSFLTDHLLPLDPWWDKLRGQPEFEGLLAEARARTGLALTAPPRDWPKDPELKKAIALLDQLESTPDDFQLAEEIAKRAVDRAPTDPEAVTVLARVESAFILRNWDFREERSVLAKRYGERAVQLAPEEPEAHCALGLYLMLRAHDYARAEVLFRRACELAPGEPRFWRALADVLGNQRPAEGVKLAEENAARFPRDALTHYNLSIQYRDAGRWDDWERELDATIALAPVANAFDWKARAALMHGNLEAMPGWLEKIPSRLRSEERAVLTSVAYAAFSGNIDFGLNALQGFPESWFRDNNNYGGPKALLKAWLLELAGRSGLARVEYEAALSEVRRRQEAAPADLAARIAEVWVLKGLNRRDEARAVFRIYLESLQRPYALFRPNLWFFDPICASLLLGERATALQLIGEAAEQGEGRETLRLRMAMDPRMAPFRDDPEIKTLLADRVAKK